uniref:Keratin, type I cytoskeletal 20 n=1 Tax=Ornithorhynchus anatinus TaxID=9258 RepID=F6YC37_ORNAN
MGRLLLGNEKLAMQNLNDRLANYLEKVHSLQQANFKLEAQIRQWYQKNSTPVDEDFSSYHQMIEELQNQIQNAQKNKVQWILKIDDVKLKEENLRIKFDNERAMCLSVEGDIQKWTKAIDDLTLMKARLEMQVENLLKERVVLKKNYQEEANNLRKHLGATINVKLDAAPGPDLGAIINEMREKYEKLAEKNIKEAKWRLEKLMIELEKQVVDNDKELEVNMIKLKELRHKRQNLGIELQSQLCQKKSLEAILGRPKTHCEPELALIQEKLSIFKAQLIQIRSESERQKDEFKILLDIKIRLEKEITTYRSLLERGAVGEYGNLNGDRKKKEAKKIRKIRMVVEEMVGGKVVSSESKEMEEILKREQKIPFRTPIENRGFLKL